MRDTRNLHQAAWIHYPLTTLADCNDFVEKRLGLSCKLIFRRASERRRPMQYGRLIRTSPSYDAASVAYIVAVAEAPDAIEFIRTKVASSGDKIEDLGRVSEALIRALEIPSGGFMRVDDKAIKRTQNDV